MTTTPSPQSAEAQEREKFEAEIRKLWTPGYSCPRDKDGNYVHAECDLAWEIWQARASLPSAAASGEASAVQEAEAEGPLSGFPEADKWVECGEARLLPMFHLSTVLQYGRRLLDARKSPAPAIENLLVLAKIQGARKASNALIDEALSLVRTPLAASPVPLSEALTFDLKTTVREYVADSLPDGEHTSEWDRGFNECKRRIHKMLTAPHNQGRVLAPVPMASSAGEPETIAQIEAHTKQIKAVHERMKEHIANESLDTYDAGLLSDFGGGNVEWWQDYIRAELDRAHDFYQSQLSAQPAASLREQEDKLDALLKTYTSCAAGMVTKDYDSGYREAIEHVRYRLFPQVEDVRTVNGQDL